jgi:hypothetical protein
MRITQIHPQAQNAHIKEAFQTQAFTQYLYFGQHFLHCAKNAPGASTSHSLE